VVYTFAAGSRKQYDFLDRNPGLSAHPVDYTNLPHNIMQNDDVVSIAHSIEYCPWCGCKLIETTKQCLK
jgi:acyl-CoA hydrolase